MGKTIHKSSAMSWPAFGKASFEPTQNGKLGGSSFKVTPMTMTVTVNKLSG
jgi:hypothetical protein